jgi:hypothetical protein
MIESEYNSRTPIAESGGGAMSNFKCSMSKILISEPWQLIPRATPKYETTNNPE